MRRVRISVGVLLTGCWGNPVDQAPQCQAYVACIRALDADAGEPTDVERFLEGGYCWNNPTLAGGCITACSRALTRMQERETSLPQECLP